MTSRIVITCIATFCVFAVMSGFQCDNAIAKKHAKRIDGEGVYKQFCSECHAGGGNTIKPSKPVAGSGKLKTLGYFKQYLSSPVGHMPFYKQIVSDKPTLNALYQYCKTLPPSHQSYLPSDVTSIASH